MMSFVRSISRILQDPPPSLAFELSEAGIATAAISSRREIDFEPLKPGVISVSPLRDNILLPDELAATVRAVAPQNGNRKRRDAALILPDYCTRMAVLDFDNFPSDTGEQLSLVRFRMKKSVPYDIESAALSYWVQPSISNGQQHDVLVAVAPLEIIARYEAPFRSAGLTPGLVLTSSVAVLPLVLPHATAARPTAVAKLTDRVLTILVLDRGVVKLIRCLELGQAGIADIAADLYPTFVYIEDNLGAKAGKLLLCGFGGLTDEARLQFERELEIEVEPLRSPAGLLAGNNAGLLGYVQSATGSK